MKKFMFLMFVIIFLAGCTSVSQRRIYDINKLQSINDWSLEFKYVPGEITKSTSSDSIKVTRYGQHPIALSFRDDIYNALKDDHIIPIQINKKNAQGKILIHPLLRELFTVTVVESVQVTITDNNQKSLARFKIEANGYNTSTTEKMTDRCIDEIVEIIKNK